MERDGSTGDRFSWKGEEKHRPTRVALSLEAVAGGTRLVLDHDGFQGFGGLLSRKMMKGGWRSKMLDKQLPAALDGMATRDLAALQTLVPSSSPMKSDSWNVSDEQVIERTGNNLAHWKKVLDAFGAAAKKTNDVVAFLQKEHDVPRDWARTLTTHYSKAH